MPKLYIIAGCNGAGKTTASYTVLPEMLGCKEFVNADEIAKGLSPFNPESVAIEAGRLMLQRMDDLLFEGEDFAFETRERLLCNSTLFLAADTQTSYRARCNTGERGRPQYPIGCNPPSLCKRIAQSDNALYTRLRFLDDIRQ